MPSGAGFFGWDPYAFAQALGVTPPPRGGYAFAPSGPTPVQSPMMSPQGTFPAQTVGEGGGEATASVGPEIGVGTASPEAQGVAGRSALAADLGAKMGVANLALSTMGLLGGPLANIAIGGLKAAMTAHNFTALTQAFENLTPAQRAALTPEQQFALAQPPTIFGLNLFSGIADPLGQKETQAFQAQRAGERGPRGVEDNPPESPDPEGVTTGPPGEASGTGAPGAGAGDSGDPGSPSDYDKGGYVKRRMLASLKGGEFVVRPEVVPRHRTLLELINSRIPAAKKQAKLKAAMAAMNAEAK